MVSNPTTDDDEDDEDLTHEEHNARVQATALELLKQLQGAPAIDAHGSVVSRFIHLDIHVRQFLQKLTPKDVRTLSRSILNIQRTGAALRTARRLVLWMLGAFGLMVAFGKNIVDGVKLVSEWLW